MQDQTAGLTNLAKLLPTTTVLTYQTLNPLITNHGHCHLPYTILPIVFISICAIACALASITDSVVENGRLYYGIAWFNKFCVFNNRNHYAQVGQQFRNNCKARYKIRWFSDVIHVVLTVVVFLSLTFSDGYVQSCFGVGSDVKQWLSILPLGMGVVASLVFLLFPLTRNGIGYLTESETTFLQQPAANPIVPPNPNPVVAAAANPVVAAAATPVVAAAANLVVAAAANPVVAVPPVVNPVVDPVANPVVAAAAVADPAVAAAAAAHPAVAAAAADPAVAAAADPAVAAAANLVVAAAPVVPAAANPVVPWPLKWLSNLVKLLPTTTVLTFQTLNPSFTNHGQCQKSNKHLTIVLIVICSMACTLASITDTVLNNGKLYYGIAHFNGFKIFNIDMNAPPVQTYKLNWLELFHAPLSVLFFVSLSVSDGNFQSCFFPGAGSQVKWFMRILPLGMGVVACVVSFYCPGTRKGIGYSTQL